MWSCRLLKTSTFSCLVSSVQQSGRFPDSKSSRVYSNDVIINHHIGEFSVAFTKMKLSIFNDSFLFPDKTLLLLRKMTVMIIGFSFSSDPRIIVILIYSYHAKYFLNRNIGHRLKIENWAKVLSHLSITFDQRLANALIKKSDYTKYFMNLSQIFVTTRVFQDSRPKLLCHRPKYLLRR